MVGGMRYENDTAGCNCFKIFATTGREILYRLTAGSMRWSVVGARVW